MNDYNLSNTSSIRPSSRLLKIFTILCLFAYFLNCSDLLFTYTFLKTGYFYEFNPIMAPIVSYPIASLIIKIIIPACLIMHLISQLPKTALAIIKIGSIFFIIITLFYFYINYMHISYLFYIL